MLEPRSQRPQSSWVLCPSRQKSCFCQDRRELLSTWMDCYLCFSVPDISRERAAFHECPHKNTSTDVTWSVCVCMCVGCRHSRTETAVGRSPLAGHASFYIASPTLQGHTHTVSATLIGELELEFSRFDLWKLGWLVFSSGRKHVKSSRWRRAMWRRALLLGPSLLLPTTLTMRSGTFAPPPARQRPFTET